MINLLRKSCGLALVSVLLLPVAAQADLDILITKGVNAPIPIAVGPFATGTDAAAVVGHDLGGSGHFHVLTAANATPAAWRGAGADYGLACSARADQAGMSTLDCQLVNVQQAGRVDSRSFSAPSGSRALAHHISDWVYQQIVGVPGNFSTRIAYIAVRGSGAERHYLLMVADADGSEPHTVLDSADPLMSPSWSADGKWLTYVSFEHHMAAVYVQQLRTGARRLVSARAGVNGAPAFSPDGNTLALTLSGSSGNLDIWLLDLQSQHLARLTKDPAADTEPAWSPDGRSIFFTSDRGGGPQIYRLEVAAPQQVTRVTFGSAYNARARVSPDGRKLAFVTRVEGRYRIALQDLATGTVTVLTHGALDESPVFAPNGATIMYSARSAGGGMLEAVSTDGQVSSQLRTAQGEVREPAWGPFEN